MFSSFYKNLDPIYKKLERDFGFLTNYGFHFESREHHYVMPSVVFNDGTKKIQIGMHYDAHKRYFIWYKNLNQFTGLDILQIIKLIGKT